MVAKRKIVKQIRKPVKRTKNGGWALFDDIFRAKSELKSKRVELSNKKRNIESDKAKGVRKLSVAHPDFQKHAQDLREEANLKKEIRKRAEIVRQWKKEYKRSQK